MTKDEIEEEIKKIEEEIDRLKKQKTQMEATEVQIKGNIEEINIKKAVVVETPDGNQRGMIALWEDGHVTVCIGDEKGHGECYTTSKEEGDKIYYVAQAWVTGLGYKVKPIHTKKVEGHFPKEKD